MCPPNRPPSNMTSWVKLSSPQNIKFSDDGDGDSNSVELVSSDHEDGANNQVPVGSK